MAGLVKDVRQTAQHVELAMGLRESPESCDGMLPCAEYDQNWQAMVNQVWYDLYSHTLPYIYAYIYVYICIYIHTPIYIHICIRAAVR